MQEIAKDDHGILFSTCFLVFYTSFLPYVPSVLRPILIPEYNLSFFHSVWRIKPVAVSCIHSQWRRNGISADLQKDDSTSRAHKPPGPGAFASCGPQSSKQTSVMLWKQPLISERRLAVKLMEKRDHYKHRKQNCEVCFPVIDQVLKCEVKDD